MIKDTSTSHLTRELFQLVKKLPHLQLDVQYKEGLTRSEYALLTVMRFNITEEKQTFSASELTTMMQITPAAGTHLFNPLEKGGYITRTPDPDDRRVSLISLTEKGEHITDDVITDLEKEINGLINYMGVEDTKTFTHLLSKAFEYLSK